MLKLRPIGKVNKGPSAPWWPNFENVKKQKMDLITRKYESSKSKFRNTMVICKICKNTQKLARLEVFCYNFGTRPKKSKIFAFPESLYMS